MATNLIDFTILDREPHENERTILIILDKGYNKDLVEKMCLCSNYRIFVNTSSDSIHRQFGTNLIPDYVIANRNQVSVQSMNDFKQNPKVNFILNTKNHRENFDKAIYLSLEKLSESSEEDYEQKKNRIIILGYLSSNTEEIFYLLSTAFKYLSEYQSKFTLNDFLFVNKSSLTAYIKSGSNMILPTKIMKQPDNSYSIISINNEANLTVYEAEGESEILQLAGNKKIKFGLSFYSSKKTKSSKVKVDVEIASNTCVIYTSTCMYHK